MKHISLFSGIGGFDLASEWAGWENLLSCEINPFGQQVVKYYWPDAYHHNDIHTLNYDTINSELTSRFGGCWRNDQIIITGGFPCQPFSMAGKRKGTQDDRHLWPEMLRIIREVRPDWVVGENVFGFINWDRGLVFDQVLSELEAEGYETQSYVLPAVSVNAPHRRDRVWIVAHSVNDRHHSGRGTKEKEKENEIQGINRQALGTWEFDGTSISRDTTDTTITGREKRVNGNERSDGKKVETGMDNRLKRPGIGWYVADTDIDKRCERGMHKKRPKEAKRHFGTFDSRTNGSSWDNFPTQSPICSRNDGLSGKLDGITFSEWRKESIKSYGNAIVPLVAFQIFRAINNYIKQ